MTYVKVIWNHVPNEYPVVLYSELGGDRYEIRKVEEFVNGDLHYAYGSQFSGTTRLGEVPVPSLQEIASDPQFEPVEISKENFERVWEMAISKGV